WPISRASPRGRGVCVILARKRPLGGRMKRLIACIAFSLATAALVHAQDGANLYKLLCATCHDGGNERAPTRDTLKQMSADRVLNAMESGPMLPMASNRTTGERRALAEFVSGKRLSKTLSAAPPAQAMCRSASDPFAHPSGGPAWNGWGMNTFNTRYQDTAAAGFSAADVPRLKVK